MKQIFPTSDKPLQRVEAFSITKEQWDSLVSIVNEYKADFDKAVADLQAFESSLKNQVTTKNIDAETADIDTANIDKANINNLNVDAIGTFIDVLNKAIRDGNYSIIVDNDNGVSVKLGDTDLVTVTNKTVDAENLDAKVRNLDVEAVRANYSVSVPYLHINNRIDLTYPREEDGVQTSYGAISKEHTWIVSDKVTLQRNVEIPLKATINTAEIKHLTAEEFDIENLDVGEDISAKNFIARETTRIPHNYKKHEPQQVTSIEDYWIVLPKFINGEYYLVLENGEDGKRVAMEFFNSINNPMFRWSEENLHDILQVWLGKWEDDSAKIAIKVQATEDLTKVYCASDTFEITKYETGWNSPTIYVDNPFEPDDDGKFIDINDTKGTYIPNATYAGEFHAEGMVVDQFIFDKLFVNETVGFKVRPGDEDSGYDVGKEYSYISNYQRDGEQSVRAGWIDPVHHTEPSSVKESKILPTEETVGNYNGEYKRITNKVSYTAAALVQLAQDDINAFRSLSTDGPDGVWNLSDHIEQGLDDNTRYWFYRSGDGEFRATIGPFKATDVIDCYVVGDTEYNITHLGDGTVTHGSQEIEEDLTVDENATVKGNFQSKHIFDGNLSEIDGSKYPNKDALVINESYSIVNDYATGWYARKLGEPAFSGAIPDDLPLISRGDPVDPTIPVDGEYYSSEYVGWLFRFTPSGAPYYVRYWYTREGDDTDYTWYQIYWNLTDGTYSKTDITGSPYVAQAEQKYQDEGDNLAVYDLYLLTYKAEVADATKLTRLRSYDATGGNSHVNHFDEIAVKNSNFEEDWADYDKKPVVYNKNSDALEPTNELTLDNLEVDDLKVNNNLDVGNDVRIAGDLYVTGTSHVVDEEVIESKSDVIVLRQGATHALMPGQESGLIINNIDGNGNDLSVVTDEEGTLRIGVAQGEKTTYTNVAYDEHTDKWYQMDKSTDPITYTELDPQPDGELTDEVGKVEDDPYTEYESVTFTVIDKESLQPFLTREEEHDINDEGILKYNKDTHRAESLDLPDYNNQSLSSTYNDETKKWEYKWKSPGAGIFRFPDQEAYEEALKLTEGDDGYIPDGSIIIIEGNYDHMLGVE